MPGLLRFLIFLKKLKQFKQKFYTLPLTVRNYQIDWLKGDEKEIYKLLADYDETELFEDQFIENLLLNHNLSRQLFRIAGMPFMIFMGSTLYYFIYILGKTFNSEGELQQRDS